MIRRIKYLYSYVNENKILFAMHINLSIDKLINTTIDTQTF